MPRMWNLSDFRIRPVGAIHCRAADCRRRGYRCNRSEHVLQLTWHEGNITIACTGNGDRTGFRWRVITAGSVICRSSGTLMVVTHADGTGFVSAAFYPVAAAVRAASADAGWFSLLFIPAGLDRWNESSREIIATDQSRWNRRPVVVICIVMKPASRT